MTMDYYSSPAASIILVHALHRSTSVRTTPAMPDINRSGSFGSPETPWQLTSQGRMHQSDIMRPASQSGCESSSVSPGLKQST
jgi:hypothetical protein